MYKEMRSERAPAAFHTATVEEVAQQYDAVSMGGIADNSHPTYTLLTALSEAAPGRVSPDANQRVAVEYHRWSQEVSQLTQSPQADATLIDAARSKQSEALRAILFLNAKTIMTAYDQGNSKSYPMEEQEDVLDTVITNIASSLARRTPAFNIAIFIHTMTSRTLQRYERKRVKEQKYRDDTHRVFFGDGREREHEDVLLKDVEDTVTLKQAFPSLPPREVYVVQKRFGLGENGDYTQEELADEFGVSRERVGQIEKNALNKLRERLQVIDNTRAQETTVKQETTPAQYETEEAINVSRFYLSHIFGSTDFFLAPPYVSHANRSGIETIGDLFSADPKELVQEWVGNPEEFTAMVLELNEWIFDPLYKQSLQEEFRGDEELLRHISDAILYKAPQEIRKIVTDGRTAVSLRARARRLQGNGEISYAPMSKKELDARKQLFQHGLRQLRTLLNLPNPDDTAPKYSAYWLQQMKK